MIKSDFLKCFTCVAILVFSLVPCRRKEIKCKAYTHSKGECVAEVSSGRILFSESGKTELPNLRTLCQDCNLGKSDRFDPNGIN